MNDAFHVLPGGSLSGSIDGGFTADNGTPVVDTLDYSALRLGGDGGPRRRRRSCRFNTSAALTISSAAATPAMCCWADEHAGGLHERPDHRQPDGRRHRSARR